MTNLLDKAIALHQQGDLHAAREYYLELEPRYSNEPRWQYMFATLLAQLRDFRSAIPLLETLHRNAHATAESLNTLAICYQSEGRNDLAEEALRQGLSLKPLPVSFNRLGNLLLERNELSEALAILKQGVQCVPDFLPLYISLGRCELRMGNPERAARTFEKALSVAPGNGIAVTNLANALRELGKGSEALDALLQLVERTPNDSQLHTNLGHVYRELARFGEAEAEFRTAMRVDPDNLAAAWNLGLIFLGQGKFTQGWPLYETGIEIGERPALPYSLPVWQPESGAANGVVICNEQGLGDEIMFASLFTHVFSRVSHSAILCEPRLRKLFERSFPHATVLAHAPGQSGPALPDGITHQVSAASLAHLLGTNREQSPCLIKADTARIQSWSEKLSFHSALPKLGVAWRGGGSFEERRKRTIPLENLEPLFKGISAHYYALQSPVSDEKNTALVCFNDFDYHNDIDGLAAFIACLDLVITVDCSVAHLAGALGKPTWILLPKSCDWRWLFEGNKAYWYNDCKLFRQVSIGDWQPVITHVSDELKRVFTPHG